VFSRQFLPSSSHIYRPGNILLLFKLINYLAACAALCSKGISGSIVNPLDFDFRNQSGGRVIPCDDDDKADVARRDYILI
jgi:hypothetical protein